MLASYRREALSLSRDMFDRAEFEASAFRKNNLPIKWKGPADFSTEP